MVNGSLTHRMKIVLVDDHPLIRDSVDALLRKFNVESVLLKAGTLHEGLRRLEEDPDVDLVLLDLQLPDTSGLDGLRTLKQTYPEIPVVVLSATEDAETILAALNNGATGYIPKSSPPDTLLAAIDLVIHHKMIYIPLQVLGIHARLPNDAALGQSAVANHTAVTLQELGIAGRAADVLEGLIEAKPLKVIARDLGIAESTVKAHAKSIYMSLRARNRAEAFVKVAELGIKFKRRSALARGNE